MSFAPYMSEQDKLDRYVNSFGTQSFRDQADRDYVAARLACRHELFPQFLWASHQAIEKYLKAILLFNRVKATRVGHDLALALSLTETLPFKIELSSRSRKFIAHLAEVGEFRYIDIPFYVHGHILIDLDLAVWEIRRKRPANPPCFSGWGIWQPAMRQQFADPTVGLSRQARQDVPQIKEGVVAVEYGRLDQTHDGGRPFAGAQAAGK